MFTRAVFALIAIAMLGTSASAQPIGQSPPPGCRAWDANLPPMWTPWTQAPAAVTAASSPANTASAAIAVARRVSVTLAPAKDVKMVVATPEGPRSADAHAGILSLHIPADGYYWVAVSEGLWIDVVSGGAVVQSTDFGHGPNCASFAKTVQFMLKAGDAFIQLSDNSGPKLDLVVVRDTSRQPSP